MTGSRYVSYEKNQLFFLPLGTFLGGFALVSSMIFFTSSIVSAAGVSTISLGIL